MQDLERAIGRVLDRSKQPLTTGEIEEGLHRIDNGIPAFQILDGLRNMLLRKEVSVDIDQEKMEMSWHLARPRKG